MRIKGNRMKDDLINKSYLTLFALLLPVTSVLADSPPTVPEGFEITRASVKNATTFPMFAVFDDKGRLYVAESSGLDLWRELRNQTRKCRVRRLEDRDGDGVFEHSVVFADKLVYPMGLAWRQGELYIADPPNIIVCRDTDGDGRSDQRRKLIGHFGHVDNGSLHGLIFGPDDRLYMTTGRPDGYKLKRLDGSILSGTTGALIRTNVDGTDPRVIARGFSNLVEACWMPGGQIVGTVNWFQHPAGGLRDALVHLTPGGRYPRWGDLGGTSLPVTGKMLPSITIDPAVAFSGMVRYEGSAFGKTYRDNLFSAQFNTRRIGRHILRPDGSTFASQDSIFVAADDPDFHPSDVLIDPDGSLLIVDTGGWYVQHCPTGKIRHSKAPGGLWRVRKKTAPRLVDPFGLKIMWARLSADELAEKLTDQRHVVRTRAREALVVMGRSAVATLRHSVQKNSGAEPALWALSRIEDNSALAARIEALSHTNPRIVTLAARTFVSRPAQDVGDALAALLSHDDAAVRFGAAESLAEVGGSSAVRSAALALRSPNHIDTFEFHNLAMILFRHADTDSLKQLLQDPSPRVRRAALVLLDHSPHNALSASQVVAAAADADLKLRFEAQVILKRHKAWANEAAPLVAGLANAKSWSQNQRQQLIDYAIVFRQNRRIAQIFAEALRRSDLKSSDRVPLIRAVGRVDRANLPDVWRDALSICVADQNPTVRHAAIDTIGSIGLSDYDKSLAAMSTDDSESVVIRIAALRAIISRNPKLSDLTVKMLVDRLALNHAAGERLAAIAVLRQAKMSSDSAISVLEAVSKDPLIAPADMIEIYRRQPSASLAEQMAGYLVKAMKQGWSIPPSVVKQIVDQIPLSRRAAIQKQLTPLRDVLKVQTKRLASYQEALKGGDVVRGKALFFGKATCVACHRIGGDGGIIGPDLTRIGMIRSSRDLLESIVLPSSTFAQRYESYLLHTRDGRSLMGIIADRSDGALTLRDAAGNETRVAEGEIEKLKRIKTSIMPEALVHLMTKPELADLIAYLSSVR